MRGSAAYSWTSARIHRDPIYAFRTQQILSTREGVLWRPDNREWTLAFHSMHMELSMGTYRIVQMSNSYIQACGRLVRLDILNQHCLQTIV